MTGRDRDEKKRHEKETDHVHENDLAKREKPPSFRPARKSRRKRQKSRDQDRYKGVEDAVDREPQCRKKGLDVVGTG